MGFALPLIGKWITAAAETVAPFVARAVPFVARAFPVVTTIVITAFIIAEILKKFKKTKEEEDVWTLPMPQRVAKNDSKNKSQEESIKELYNNTDELVQPKREPKSDSTNRPVAIPVEEQKKTYSKSYCKAI